MQIKNFETIHTAVVRGRVEPRELSRFVPAACGEVWSFIRSAGLPCPGRHVALYLDSHGSVEVGAEVSELFVGNERVHCSQLPGGRVVTTTHFGLYARLFEAHREVRQWCAGQGHRLAGVCWEIYGHWEENWNADPSRIRTDVFHLLQEPARQLTTPGPVSRLGKGSCAGHPDDRIHRSAGKPVQIPQRQLPSPSDPPDA